MSEQQTPIIASLEARVRELEAFVLDVYNSHGKMYWTELYERSKVLCQDQLALGLGAREQPLALPGKDEQRPQEISWIGQGWYMVNDWDRGKVFEGTLEECHRFVRQQKDARIDEVNECKVREAQARGISR